MAKYSIGIDYGTLSGRALLVNVETGEELASAVYEYPHAVIDTALPKGARLGVNWALEDPHDFLEVLSHTVPEILKKTGVSPDDIVGVGTDFTACTLIPAKKDGTPLSFLPEYENIPHAWCKLWKHHAAQPQADRLNEIAEKRGEKWLPLYGGKTSSEWTFPKVMQVVEEAPEIYAAADVFVEAADWIVWQLTGKLTRNACTAGYKALWNKTTGYPSKEFLKALDPELENFIEEKFYGPVLPLGDKAGEIDENGAKLTGLKVGTPVSVGNVDAHVCVPAVKIATPGKIMAIMGTSTCHMLLGEEEKCAQGICGVVADGILPGYYGYEAGQSCVGDHFAWMIENCLTADYVEDAKKQGKNLHVYLTEKAAKQKVGEHGLIALDWWNGNRSVLTDASLTGVLLGMTLQTKPEDIYRALIEATAYGTRMIVDTYKKNGIRVDEIIASGGISQKNAMAMQIYSDVLNMPVRIAGSDQGPALGSAIFGALASGYFKTAEEAANVMGKLKDTVYMPIAENVRVYEKLYAEYAKLHDYFGRGENNVMKNLNAIKAAARGE